MAKQTMQPTQARQRLSRKTKKALVNSVGREQYHQLMAEYAHDSTTKAQAKIFAQQADQPYLIQSGKLRRLKAFGNNNTGR